MSKFTRKTLRPAADIGTSALPDIIFMLLFFFMVVTVLRDHQVLLKIEVPEVNQAQKLQHRSLIHNIYIGRPQEESLSQTTVIQINDAFVRIEEVELAVWQMVIKAPEAKRGLVTTNLRVDKKVEMGLVTDVKTEIRKAEQYKLNYAANKAAF